MGGTTRAFTTSLALRVFLLFVFLGQGAVLRGSVFLLVSPQSVAVTLGTRCPLMYHLASHTQLATSHCPTHETAESRHPEWRCACGAQSQTATPDPTVTRFLLPCLAEFLAPPNGVLELREGLAFFPNPFFSPPDPPPRVVLSILV
jgi:hypothetical protein